MTKLIRWSVLITVSILGIALLAYYNFAATLNDVEEPKYSDSSPSFQMPFNRLVLVRSGEKFGAFRITRRISRGGMLNGASYDFWFKDGNSDLTTPETVHGKGEIYEKNKVVRQLRDNEQEVVDAGSETTIRVGPLLIEWSQGNHIYAHSVSSDGTLSDEVSDFEIAASMWEHVGDVNFSDSSLTWLSTKHSSLENMIPREGLDT